MTRLLDTPRVLVYLVVIVVALALATGATAVTAGPLGDSSAADVDADVEGAMTLEVVDESDETVIVELSTGLDDVAGYHANLYYDEEVATIESVAGGEGNFDNDPIQNVDNENGSVTFNHANPPSEAENAPTLATITFTVSGGQTEVAFDVDGADPVVDSHIGLDTTQAVFDLAKEPIVIGEDDGEGPASPSPPDDPGDGPGGGSAFSDDPTDVPSNVTADVTPFENGVTMVASDVSAGDTVVAVFEEFSDGSTAISGISLEMAGDATRVGLDTEFRPNRPADVAELSGSEPVTYVEFTPDGFGSADLASASVSFEVSEDALPDGATADDVQLYRSVNDSWEPLETAHQGDDTYVAETPGFSTFVVGVKRADLSVTDASLLTDTVSVGETATVEATVKNTGNADGEVTVTLRVDGEIVDERTVSVPANSETTTTFPFSSDDAGGYMLSVDDSDAGTLSVSDHGTVDGEAAGDAAVGDSEDTFERFGEISSMLVVLIALVAVAAAGIAIRRW